MPARSGCTAAIDTNDSNSLFFPSPHTQDLPAESPPRFWAWLKDVSYDPTRGCRLPVPQRHPSHSFSTCSQLLLCPRQLLLKLLGQASLFPIAILFLLKIKEMNRFAVPAPEVTRSPWVSTSTICSPLGWLYCGPCLVKITWTLSRVIASEFQEVAPPTLCTLASSPGNSWTHLKFGSLCPHVSLPV